MSEQKRRTRTDDCQSPKQSLQKKKTRIDDDPSSQGGQIGSAFSLENALQRENVNIVTLSDEYFDLSFNYGSKTEGRKLFIKTLIMYAGLPDSVSFDDVNFQFYLTQKNMTSQYVPILKKNFRNHFGDFVYHLFLKRDGIFILDDNFFEILNRLASQLMKGKYDSHRIIATIVGVKMLSCIHYLNNKMTESGATSIENQLKVRNNADITWTTLYSNIVKPGLRDCSPAVSGIIMNELLKWANLYPPLLIKDELLRLVMKSCRSQSDENKRMGFLILLNLSENIVNEHEHAELFKYSRNELIACLDEAGVFKEIAIKTLYHISLSLTTMDLSVEERQMLHLAIYYPDQVVGYYAAKLFETTYLSYCNTSMEKLLKLLALYDASTQDNFDVMVDSFSWYFAEHFDMEEWMCVINSAETVNPSASLFYDMAKRIIFNEPPQMRTNHIQILTDFQSKSFSQKLSFEMKNNWLRIVQFSTVETNSTALVKIIGLLEFLDLEIFPSYVLLQFWTAVRDIFLSSLDQEIVNICGLILGHLAIPIKENTLEARKIEFINKVYMHFDKWVLQSPIKLHDDNEKMSAERMKSVAKYILFDDRNLWVILLRKAKELNTDPITTPELALSLMKILFALTFRKHFEVNSLYVEVKTLRSKMPRCEDEIEKITTEIARLEVVILPRIFELEDCYTRVLDPNVPTYLREEGYFFLIQLFRICGPHIQNDGHFLFLPFDKDFINKISLFALESMKLSCEGDNTCCTIVDKYLRFIDEGIIDSSFFEDFILCLSNNEMHTKTLLSSLQRYINKFNKSGSTLLVNLMANILKKHFELENIDHFRRADRMFKAFFTHPNFKAGATMLLPLHIALIREPHSQKNVFLCLQLLRRFLSGSETRELLQILDDSFGSPGANLVRNVSRPKTSPN